MHAANASHHGIAERRISTRMDECQDLYADANTLLRKRKVAYELYEHSLKE